MKSLRAAAALLAAGALLHPRASLHAQQTSEMVTVSLTVVSPPVLLEGFRNLEFGLVMPGETIRVTAIDPPDGTVSGAVRFSNLQRQRSYSLAFSLPEALTRGSSQIHAAWDDPEFGYLCLRRSNVVSCDNNLSASFMPTEELRIDFPHPGTQGTNFTADVSIGGQLVVPVTGVAPGIYRGTITATLTIIS
jgi:spore coat protein U-like protein